MELGCAAARFDKGLDAQLCYGEALELREKLFGGQSEIVASTYVRIAWYYQGRGEKVQARNTFDQALMLRDNAGARETDSFATLLDESASLYAAQKDEKRAHQQYDLAIAIRERLWKSSDPRFLISVRATAERTSYEKDPAYPEKL